MGLSIQHSLPLINSAFLHGAGEIDRVKLQPPQAPGPQRLLVGEAEQSPLCVGP